MRARTISRVFIAVSCLFSRIFFSECLFPTQKVSVFDNVLSTSTRSILHQAAKDGGLGHKAFSRPLEKGKHGSIEQALDSILTEIGDNSQYVEYWTRQEWRSIEAHADVDEFSAKQQDANGEKEKPPFRYPTNGHVLYLQVGENVRGPTCVFPDRKTGGDLLRSIDSDSEDGSVELVTVPAVPGRLLRFFGDYLHAVPRPADFWLLKFVQGAPQYEPEEEWGRSVILFNTWDDPPLDVPLNSNDKSSNENVDCETKSNWIETFDLSQDTSPSCVAPMDDSQQIPAKIWLLGNERRRDFPMRTLKLDSDEGLKTALFEESKVSRVILRQ